MSWTNRTTRRKVEEYPATVCLAKILRTHTKNKSYNKKFHKVDHQTWNAKLLPFERHVKKMKGKTEPRRGHFARHLPNKWLTPRICKEHWECNSKKSNNPIKDEQKMWTYLSLFFFFQMDIQMFLYHLLRRLSFHYKRIYYK